MHRVRFAMAQDYSTLPKLGGLGEVIEADETYVGGKPRNKQPGKGPVKGWLQTRKLPVVSLVERGGQIRSFVTADVTARNIGRILQENASLDSHLMTDSSNVYKYGVGKPFRAHGMTDHHAGQYALPDGTHSNTVESAFSLLKRGIMGTFHNISRKHLHRYVAEFDFRWNTRKFDDGARTATAIRQAEGKRLRYKEPAATVAQ
jgi:hypothetical protein